MNTQRSLLALLIASILTACGGSSSSSTAVTPVTPVIETKSLTGHVADGYLVDATVCLDENKNKACDADEPQAVSTKDGKFTLTGVTQAQIDGAPLLVQIIKDKTSDTDEPGVLLSKAYTLSAPAGYTFVSLNSTLAQNLIEKGSTLEEAEKIVQQGLNTTIELDKDYIAGAKNNSYSAEKQADFKKLHRVVQTLTKKITADMAAFEETAEQEGIANDELQSVLVSAALDSLYDITKQVEVAIDAQEFDAASLAKQIDLGITKETLKEQVEQNKKEKSAGKLSLMDVMQTDGINWFSGETYGNNNVDLEYGTTTIDADGTAAETAYLWNGKKWEEEKDNDDNDDEYLLTANGWMLANDSLKSVTLNQDQSVTLHTAQSAFDSVVTGTKLSLDGLNIALMMRKTEGDGAWAKRVDPAATFPDGSVAYKLYISEQSAVNYQFYDWYCSDEEKIEGLCNTVTVIMGSEPAIKAIKLADLVVDKAIELSGTADDVNNLKGISVGERKTATNSSEFLTVELVANHSVNFYATDYSHNSDNGYPTVSKLKTAGTWEDKVVYGQTLRTISKLTSAAALDGFFNEDTDIASTILFEHEGAVRIGKQKKAEVETDLLFNDIAKDAILDNFHVDAFTQEWLSGRTLYNVSKDTGTSSWQLAEFSFRASTLSAFNLDAESGSQVKTVLDDVKYEITDKGYIQFDDPDEGAQYIKVASDQGEYLRLGWSDKITNLDNNSSSADSDFFFYDLESAKQYISDHSLEK